MQHQRGGESRAEFIRLWRGFGPAGLLLKTHGMLTGTLVFAEALDFVIHPRTRARSATRAKQHRQRNGDGRCARAGGS